MKHLHNYTEANHNFAVDLFKQQMKERHHRNCISFPFGTQITLALLLLGSRGITADEIRKVLHILKWIETVAPTDDHGSGTECDKPGGYHTVSKQILSRIFQHTKHNTLKLGSRLYGSDLYDFLEHYGHCIKDLYNADMDRVDFTNSAEENRKKINSWVERQTNGDVPNFFPPNSIDRTTALILLCVAYLNIKWQIQFNPKDTRREVFWTCEDQSIYVDMMTRRGRFNLANISNPRLVILEMPLANEEFSMFFFLPEHPFTPDEIVANLTAEQLKEWTRRENMRSVETKVSMPKYRITNEYALKSTLSKMGIKDLFTPGRANLSGMTGDDKFLVSQINQAILLTVNEEGGEAVGASRTEVVSGTYPDIKMNKPFIFLIKHNATDVILFLGRICVPK